MRFVCVRQAFKGIKITSPTFDGRLAFSLQSGVRPMIETMPLARAAQAYERMMSNQARFRMVLTMAP